MSEQTQQQLLRAYQALKQARAEIESLKSSNVATTTGQFAIVGMACKLPGNVDTPDQLWELMLGGKTTAGERPSERAELFNIDDHVDPELIDVSINAGYLASVAGFDAKFFRMSKAEADSLDPQQRLLLQTTWHALENAGYRSRDLQGKRVGVFVGMYNRDYASLAQALPSKYHNSAIVTGILDSLAAGRIAYYFDWKGPTTVIDTACSSSLVALHQACNSLTLGECEAALVGGVNLILHPGGTASLVVNGALSRDGLCKSYDNSADGYGRAEGCAAVLIKPLSAAQEAGDNIIAVVRGSAVNHDGRSNGVTAPNKRMQIDVLAQALARANLHTSDIHGIEGHGTGTVLGDAIELSALKQVFSEGRGERNPLLLGSVKSHIGHTEGCSGLAGLIRAVLICNKRQFPASPQFKHPNESFDWQGSAIQVPQQTVGLDHIEQLRIGVSSFGLSGTNCHVVVEQFIEPASGDDLSPLPKSKQQMLTLSAATAEALDEMVLDTKQFIQENPQQLMEVCRALNLRNNNFEYRIAFSFDDLQGYFSELNRYLLKVEGNKYKEPDGESMLGLKLSDDIQLPVSHMSRALSQTPAIYMSAKAALQRLDKASVTISNKQGMANLDLGKLDKALACFVFLYSLLAGFSKLGIRFRAFHTSDKGLLLLKALVDAGALNECAHQWINLEGAQPRRWLARINGKRIETIELNVGLNEPVQFEGMLGVSAQGIDWLNLRLIDQTCVESASDSLVDSAGNLLLSKLAMFYPKGVEVDWKSFYWNSRKSNLELPLYPFQLEAFWLDREGAHGAAEAESLDDWIFEERWMTRCSSEFFEPIVDSCLKEQVLDHQASSAPDFAAFDIASQGLCECYVLEAFDALGADFEVGERFTLVEFLSRLKIVPSHYKFIEYCLRLLQQNHVLEFDGVSSWMITQGFVDGQRGSDRLFREITQQFSSHSHELKLLRRSGSSLTDLLRGKIQPHAVLFPNDEATLLDSLYRSSSMYAFGVEKIVEAVTQMLERRPADLHQPIRILEIGARTGVCLQALASLQAKYGFEYWCTEENGYFKEELQRLDVSSGVRIASFDPDQPLEIQALPEQAFDIVIANGALHRCNDVQMSLASVYRLLKPAGTLLTYELFQQQAWIDLIFGVAPKWWEVDFNRADESHPFLSQAAWRTLLEDSGFLVHQSVEQSSVAGLVTSQKPSYSALSDVHEGCDIPFHAGWIVVYHPGAESQVQALRRSMRVRGCDAFEVRLIREGDTSVTLDGANFDVNRNYKNGYYESIGQILDEQVCRIRGLIYLTESGSTETLDEQACEIVESTLQNILYLGHAINELVREPEFKFAVVDKISGAEFEQPELSAAAQSYAGFLRTLVLEHIEVGPTLIGYAGSDQQLESNAIVSVLGAPLYENELIVAGESVCVPRIFKVNAEDGCSMGGEDLSLDNQATYVITGGLGALGMEAARLLVEKGAKYLLLLTRHSERHPDALTQIEKWCEDGIKVVVSNVDVADYSALQAVWQDSLQDRPIKGVIHAAGVVFDAMFVDLGWFELEKVLRAKTYGTANLHQLTRGSELDFFVMYSSLSAISGSPGQANYSAANAFMDGVARFRRAQGLPAMTINWPTWDGMGLAANVVADKKDLTTGIRGLSREQGRELLLKCLSLNLSNPTLMQADRDQLRMFLKGFSFVRPYFSEIFDFELELSSPSQLNVEKLLKIAEYREGDELRVFLAEHLQVHLEEVVASSIRHVPIDVPLADLGMDSLVAFEFKNRVNRALGVEIPLSTLLKGPTVENLADEVVGWVEDAQANKLWA